jgi:hypothetical protein
MRPEPKVHPTTRLRHVIVIVVASTESYLIAAEASDPTAIYRQLADLGRAF